MSRIAHLLSGIAIAATTLGLTTPAQAQQTIECRSNNYGYNECDAGDLSSPQLIHQTSSSALSFRCRRTRTSSAFLR